MHLFAKLALEEPLQDRCLLKYYMFQKNRQIECDVVKQRAPDMFTKMTNHLPEPALLKSVPCGINGEARSLEERSEEGAAAEDCHVGRDAPPTPPPQRIRVCLSR